MNYHKTHNSDLADAHSYDPNDFGFQLVADIPDCLPGLVACVDCNMVVKYCNKLFREWSSFDTGLAGLSFPILAGSSLFDQIQRQMGRVLIGQKAKFQAFIRNGDAPVQYLDVFLTPQFDVRKRVRGFVFYATDVTAKVELERGLSDYFENASICLHWVDENGIIVWANPTELKTLGYEKEEYIGRHISEFHAKPGVINDILTRLANKEVLVNVDAEGVCKDGTTKNVLVNSSVLWENDKFVHTRCFTIDVTQQKHAADAARQIDERFRQMANLVPLVIWTTGRDGRCNFINDRWVETTGRPIEEGLGDGWMNFIHPDDREKIRMSWLESIRNSKVFEAKMRLQNARSRHTITYINCKPQVSERGELLGYIGIFQDISSQEEVKAALEQIVLQRTKQLSVLNQNLSLAKDDLQRKNGELLAINNQLSSFAHIASHDLQEPLRKVQTLLSFLFEIEGSHFSEKGIDLFRRIHDSSQRMRALIQDLLTYASNELSASNFEVVNINEIVSDVLTELDTRITTKKAVISVGELPTIYGIRFQLHQLFLNLVSNALKFSRPDVPPVISIYSDIREGNHVPGLNYRPGYYNMITVKDNGIGFESEYGSKIFEMFQRLHRSQKYEGTGIGLAICKKVVDNHKGSIVAESAPGYGATFKVFLPIMNEPNKNNFIGAK
jgi:PAS domain S-box-containing protein